MSTANALKLKVSARKELGKQLKNLRKSGQIPGVVYGHNIQSTPIALDKKEFLSIFSKSGENTLIKLDMDSRGEKTVLVHDVQHHFLTSDPIHVDFYEVKMTEKIHTKVPLAFMGEAKAVKDLGGILIKNYTELEIESLPTDIPHEFQVDLSKLNSFEDSIAVADIVYDRQKVKILAKPEEILVKAAPPRSEEELKSLEEKPVEEVAAVEGVIKPEAGAEEQEAEGKKEKVEEKTSEAK